MDPTNNLIYSKMILAGRDSDQIIKEREKDRNTINYVIEKIIRHSSGGSLSNNINSQWCMCYIVA